MSYTIVSRPRRSLGSAYAPTVPPPDSSLPTFNDAILEDVANRRLVACPGTHGVYNQTPDEPSKCCGRTTWMENTTRRVLGESTWRMYLERIVRDNVVTYINGQAVDNAARDLPNWFMDAPRTLTYSPSLVAAADQALANFWDLFQQGRHVVNKQGVATPCKADGYYDTASDPGNPDKQIEAAAYKRIFGRDPSDAEKADLMAKAWALFESMWRKTGSDWAAQAIMSDGEWNGYWTYTTGGTVAPTTWTKGFLDIFNPSWKKTAIAPSMTKASVSAVKPKVRLATPIIKRSSAVVPRGASTSTGTKTTTGTTTPTAPKSSTTTWLILGGAGLLAASAVAIYMVRK